MAHRQLDLRIALVGKTGVGKSGCGNTILGRPAFVSTLSTSSVTSECQKETGDVDGQKVAVVDTPGLYDTRMEMDVVKREVAKAVCFSSPGPHVFLIVIQPNRFTREEQETVKILQRMFGEEAGKYSMVLFTHGDDIERENTTIETLISESQPLRDFISQCGGGYHVFNNRDEKNRVQVTELLKKINKMVQMNGGRCYSNEMFQQVERVIKGETKRLLTKNPDMDPEVARTHAERNTSVAPAVIGGAVCFGTWGAAVGFAAGPVGALVGGAIGAAVGAGVAVASSATSDKCLIQ